MNICLCKAISKKRLTAKRGELGRLAPLAAPRDGATALAPVDYGDPARAGDAGRIRMSYPELPGMGRRWRSGAGALPGPGASAGDARGESRPTRDYRDYRDILK